MEVEGGVYGFGVQVRVTYRDLDGRQVICVTVLEWGPVEYNVVYGTLIVQWKREMWEDKGLLTKTYVFSYLSEIS